MQNMAVDFQLPRPALIQFYVIFPFQFADEIKELKGELEAKNTSLYNAKTALSRTQLEVADLQNKLQEQTAAYVSKPLL